MENEELRLLSGKDINLDLKNESNSPYFTTSLTFRKTNQADASKANVYEIYPRPDEPHACCFTKLTTWLQWLEENARPLGRDDFLFPSPAKDGRVKLGKAISYECIKTLLNQFATDAGLLDKKHGRYTTHCFRRGGAQYRFMFSNEKWSLKAVQWWGGWSQREAVDTIMRYLLDGMAQYESSFGDMLSPTRSNNQGSVFKGSSLRTEPETYQTPSISLGTQQSSIINKMDQNIKQLQQAIRILEQELSKDNYPAVAISRHLQIPDQRNLSSSAIVEHFLPSYHKAELPFSTTQGGFTAVAPRIPDINTWREAVRQWKHGDSDKGLAFPLSDWTCEMRKTDPSRYSQRKLVAAEFTYLDSDDKKMEDTHSGSLFSVNQLVASIRQHNRARRRSTSEASKRKKTSENYEEEEKCETKNRLVKRRRNDS
ncbi:hypothetical protein BGZ46_004412 [Entomortierella lignicola]|nr:hypothetical protein BGZ46_004412 [Entomortierella lignicola]